MWRDWNEADIAMIRDGWENCGDEGRFHTYRKWVSGRWTWCTLGTGEDGTVSVTEGD